MLQSRTRWASTFTREDNNQQRIKLKEGVDYELIVDYMSNKALIKSQCGISTTLGQKKNGYI
ncbi:unnamed protein product, partial [Rotaria magnacalcarata]